MLGFRVCRHAAVVSLSACALIVPTISQAAAAPADGALSSHVKAFRLGYSYSHFDRQEQSYDEDKGYLNGVYLSGDFIGNHLYMRGALTYDAGTVDYTGGIQYNNGGALGWYPYKTKTKEKLLTSSFDIGPAFRPFTDRNVIAPFVGMGVRYQEGSTDSDTVTVPGVGTGTVLATQNDRVEYQGRFGLMDRLTVTPRLHVQFTALGTYNFTGRITNKAGYDGDYKGHEKGFKVSGLVDYRLWKSVGLYARVGYTKDKTSRVDFTPSRFEPKAKTDVMRYTVGVIVGRF